MSEQVNEPKDDLGRFLEDLEQLVGIVTLGTADQKRRVRRLRLTVERIQSWRSEANPVAGPDRGGSSSPTEAAERREDRQVTVATLRDDQTARGLVADLAPGARQLAQMVARYTTPIDHSKLPKPEDIVPGCVSCARQQQEGKKKTPGHFNPIDDRYKGLKLCRWCGDHREADGALPSLDLVDVYHRQGPQAAGRLAATQRQYGDRRDTRRLKKKSRPDALSESH